MRASWEALEKAGLPYGAPAVSGKVSSLSALAGAVIDVLGQVGNLDYRQRIGTLAWLRAWASDYPTSFHAAFGGRGDELLRRAASGLEGDGQYLKLRRIARANLARVF